MSLLSFFARRFFTGAVARAATNSLTRRFKLSPAASSVAFVVLTEMLARATERPATAGGRFSRRG